MCSVVHMNDEGGVWGVAGILSVCGGGAGAGSAPGTGYTGEKLGDTGSGQARGTRRCGRGMAMGLVVQSHSR